MIEGGPSGVVMLVDDSPETLRFLIDALEDAGLAALVARDGTAALGLLERITPDVILLDLVMPGIDGFDLCRRIKARADLSTTPVVFVTGRAETDNVVEGLRAGGVDYLVKPIHPEELIARISTHVANARLIANAREAVDAAGGAIIALRSDGSPSWGSPRALSLLVERLGAQWKDHLRACATLRRWLASVDAEPLPKATSARLSLPDAEALQLSVVGRSGAGDVLVRLAEATTEDPAVRIARALNLSGRESEVLVWLARGKSNRDIATILSLSPRTVTKHVEQIFAKLGVENRTSAAIIAYRYLEVV